MWIDGILAPRQTAVNSRVLHTVSTVAACEAPVGAPRGISIVLPSLGSPSNLAPTWRVLLATKERREAAVASRESNLGYPKLTLGVDGRIDIYIYIIQIIYIIKKITHVSREFDEFRVNFFFFFFILRRMGKNIALAHHTSTYFHTRRVLI